MSIKNTDYWLWKRLVVPINRSSKNTSEIPNEICKFLKKDAYYTRDIHNGFKIFKNTDPLNDLFFNGYTFFIEDEKKYTYLTLKYGT